MNLLSKKYINIFFFIYLFLVLFSFVFYLFSDFSYLSVIIGSISAIFPVPLYLYLTTRLDTKEPEPKWALFSHFTWGATIAFIGSYIINSIVDQTFYNMNYTSVISAPIVEEFFKCLGLLIFFLFFKKYFNNFLDGIMYATMVALGFAMSENISYYIDAYHSNGISSLFRTILSRGVATVFAHPMFTMFFGISLAFSLKLKNKISKVVIPILGYILSVVFHALWNGSIILDVDIFKVFYIIVVIPMIILIIYIYKNQKKEGNDI